jgi:hypothetical protein
MKPNGRLRLFELGEVVATPGLLAEMQKHTEGSLETLCAQYLDRHASGDWGELCAEDKAANDRAVIEGSRIFSAYLLPDNQTKFWLITEADRSVTTFLLPSEY